jgi:hypothetical protein
MAAKDTDFVAKLTKVRAKPLYYTKKAQKSIVTEK